MTIATFLAVMNTLRRKARRPHRLERCPWRRGGIDASVNRLSGIFRLTLTRVSGGIGMRGEW